jgi:hypothetical protein
VPPLVLPMRSSRSVRLIALPAPSWLSRSCHASLSLIVVGATLGGCTDGPGQFAVDPGRYEFHHCNDLVRHLKELREKETELRSLMTKASEGGGGGLVGELAYRPDYESVLTQQKMVMRVAAEKKCNEIAPPTTQSDTTQGDQAIR